MLVSMPTKSESPEVEMNGGGDGDDDDDGSSCRGDDDLLRDLHCLHSWRIMQRQKQRSQLGPNLQPD